MKPLEKAFSLGQRAFVRGVFKSPYSSSSFLHKEWQRGWSSKYLSTRRLQEGSVGLRHETA